MDKILVAYGSGAGSTAEVAEAIGEEMQRSGAIVDVVPAEAVKNLSGYGAVVVGSGVRMGRLLGVTRRFLRKHRKTLQSLPAAYFVVCMTLKQGTPENLEIARKYAQPFLAVKEPINLGLFAGAMDPEKLSPMLAAAMKNQPREDARDWDKIRQWARETWSQLSASR